MDGNRFDALTRMLAERRLSRRAALAGAAGILAAGAGRNVGAQVSQVQCGNKICAHDPGVCNDGCVCCTYSNGNSRCRPPGTCAPGTVACPHGQVIGPSGACVAPTTTTTSTTTTPAPTTTTTTTTTATTAPPLIGDCQGTDNGGVCGAGGAGRCDNGRCFRTDPGCGQCGGDTGHVPSSSLSGVIFCVPYGGSASETPCQTSADCAAAGRPGDFCARFGEDLLRCTSGCLE